MTGVVERVESGKGTICRDVLLALPQWFGLPQAISQYTTDVEQWPMFGLRMDGAMVGFLSLKFHTRAAAEAYVLGIRRPWQRRGGGKLLFAAAEAECRSAGVNLLTVKTLAASHPDRFYARTRAFYRAIGFVPLEVFPTLWGADHPCLMMIKLLQPAPA